MTMLFIASIVAYSIATYFRVKEKVAGRPFKHHTDFSLYLALVCNMVLASRAFVLSDTHLHYQGLFIFGSLSLGISALAIEKGLKESFFSIFTIPSAIVFLICATFVDGKLAGEHFLQGWFALHLFLAILGEIFFCIAALSSITYLYVIRRLKKKNRLRAVFLFPPLTRLDDLTFKLIKVGTSVFFLGLVIGLYGNYSHFSEFKPVLKHVFAGIVMCFYLLVIILRKPMNIAGNKLAVVAVAGFILSLGLIIIPDNAAHWKPLIETNREAAR